MLKHDFVAKSGFTLTEVIIGIMILTVAIVSASNLLVSLVRTNRANVQTMQAYFLAQEGLEAVRNIRDTNWLHNLDFRGEDGLYDNLEEGKYYAVFLDNRGWEDSRGAENVSNIGELNAMKPWKFTELSYSPFNVSFGVQKDDFRGFITGAGISDKPVFYRYIQILDACDNDPVLADILVGDECDDFILVKSVVEWRDGSKNREVALREVLSNWKGGAL